MILKEAEMRQKPFLDAQKLIFILENYLEIGEMGFILDPRWRFS